MHVYTLRREQFVPVPREKVFAFFQQPENLETITPDNLAFKMLTPLPISMHPGAVIDYVIKMGIFPMRWTTIITNYQPPELFTDIQIRGPYAFWHHSHHFEESAEGTLIKDSVHYSMPLGTIGRLVHFLIVRRQLRKIFQYRQDQIQQIFGL
jgi:ligand-binding SRPBCC domain-containing protein